MEEQKLFTKDDIAKDIKVRNTFVTRKINNSGTKNNYLICLTDLCNIAGKTPTQIIKELKEEQRNRIENNIIIEYDPNDGTLNSYFFDYITKKRNEGNKDTTIKNKIDMFRTFFNANGIKLPKTIKFDDDSDEWYLLTWDMIKYAIDMGTITERALYSFTASKGDRIEDIQKLTIGDFMEATYDYHHCTEIDDFLEKAPQNMIGYWEDMPIKTQNHKIKSANCNSAESSNYLLEYLNFRQDKLSLKNKKYNTDYKLKKTDGLFAPYKRVNSKYSLDGLHSFFTRTNKLLKEKIKKDLKQKLDKNEISIETYTKEIEEIPNFSSHALRKYNHSVLANNRIPLRICAKMEGHTPPGKMDNSYIVINKETIINSFNDCIKDLSFEKTEINTIDSPVVLELKDEIEKLKVTNMLKTIEQWLNQAIYLPLLTRRKLSVEEQLFFLTKLQLWSMENYETLQYKSMPEDLILKKFKEESHKYFKNENKKSFLVEFKKDSLKLDNFLKKYNLETENRIKWLEEYKKIIN